MQLQFKLLQPLPEVLQKAVRFGLPLEPQHDIVGITDHDHRAVRAFLSPRLHPEVESVVQVNVSQQRRYHRPLRRTLLRFRPLAFLHHSGFQPFLDQPQDPAVGHAMLHELEHPLVG